MIRELAELGEKNRQNDTAGARLIHDALKEETMSIDLVINADGSFVQFIPFEKKTTAEAIFAKKGKARLLLDKAEEVLEYGGEKNKHKLFLDKLDEYKELKELEPVRLFYAQNKNNGLERARKEFEKQIPEKERSANIAFRLNKDQGKRIHEQQEVLQKIIEKREKWEKSELAKSVRLCSICGKNNHPVVDLPHGMIKNVPDGQKAGCALVSYNEKAYESYDLEGNLNSSICTHCAITYVEGLNWLLSNGQRKTDKKTKKDYMDYTNRKNLGNDTAILFWAKSNQPVNEIKLLDEPVEEDIFKLIQASPLTIKHKSRDEDVKGVLNSIQKGKADIVNNFSSDVFYSFTLSGAAARIAVRDWIETSLENVRLNIKQWFLDTAISKYENGTGHTVYQAIRNLAEACGTYLKKEKNGKDYYELDKKDPFVGRAGNILWGIALMGKKPPLNLLDRILRRIRLEGGRIYEDRAALIRLILNRNRGGNPMILEKLDSGNKQAAYVCGKIFAVLESIQYQALGDTNAGIRDRFFSAASLTPATTFGRLLKMTQHHLSKLRNEKPGLAINLDKDLQVLISQIHELPSVFNLEEQGQFAIGYYHKRQEIFNS
ncbi:MAG: type I-C CRISPR-associated protein Cas8c/Csd1 [Brevinematales bacterium]|jgi:CRISPR-associated protein Csd1